MSYKVRRATHDDVPEILIELKEFSHFFDSKLSLMNENDDFNSDLLMSFISDHLFLVAVDENEAIVGFISGFILPHVFNPEIETLSESFWWVKKGHREGGAGLMLLNEFIKFGKDNVDWIITTLEYDSPVNERSLTKRGFKLKERSYIMEVN